MCVAIGKLTKMSIEPMTLGTNNIEWVNSIKYLGVTITGGNSLGFNNGPAKQSFFVACNCIYANAEQLDELLYLITGKLFFAYTYLMLLL